MDEKLLLIFRSTFNDSVKKNEILESYIQDEYNRKRLLNSLKSAIYRTKGTSILKDLNHLGEITQLFTGICRGMDFNESTDLAFSIDKFIESYQRMLNDNPYFSMLLNTLNKIYSNTYDGKPGFDDKFFLRGITETYFEYDSDSFKFGKIKHKASVFLPNIKIKSIKKLNDAIQEFITTLYSDENSLYNIYKIEGFKGAFTTEELTQIVLEGIILNSTEKDLENLEGLFRRYLDFLTNTSLDTIKTKDVHRVDTGEFPGYELYCNLKRSDIEYETPYYISLNICSEDRQFGMEMPNVRFGITTEDGYKKAYIVSVQTSQKNDGLFCYDLEKADQISQIIKDNIPKTTKYRYFNPNHLASIVITYGILKGMGIHTIEIVNYTPIRYRKTLCDKNYDESEFSRYLNRVCIMQKNTFDKINIISQGIFKNFPLKKENTELVLTDNITFNSEFLNKLYQMGFNFGQSKKSEELNYGDLSHGRN